MLTKTFKNINGLNISTILSPINYNTKKRSILMLHGFPELGYSFRKLIEILSSNGYYCIAPDQRGYGKTKFRSREESKLNKFSVINLAKDMKLLLQELNIEKVDVIGHDYGSYVSSYLAMLYPEIINSLVIMSMPFSGPLNKSKSRLLKMKKINKDLAKLSPKRKHYQNYFCTPNAADNMLYCQQGINEFFRGYFYFKSHNYKNNRPFRLKHFNAKELSKLPEYYIMLQNLGMSQTIKNFMPDEKILSNCKIWLSEKDLKYYSEAFKKSGFKNPLKNYRILFSSKEVENIIKLRLPTYLNIPSMFIAGESDWGMYQKPGDLEDMEKKFFKNFLGIKIVKYAGHWVQQENPIETANYLLDFYDIIDRIYS